MRFCYAQREQESCGAVCAMVALAELAGDTLNSHKEILVWDNVKRGNNSKGLSKDESEPARIVEYLTKQGRKVAVIENTVQTTALRAAVPALKVPHDFYKAELAKGGVVRTLEALAEKHFQDDARVFLVVAFKDGANYLTHFVLVRRETAKYYIMNPDQGKDVEFTSKDLFDFVGWARVPPPQLSIGTSPASYLFTGIAIRVT